MYTVKQAAEILEMTEIAVKKYCSRHKDPYKEYWFKFGDTPEKTSTDKRPWAITQKGIDRIRNRKGQQGRPQKDKFSAVIERWIKLSYQDAKTKGVFDCLCCDGGGEIADSHSDFMMGERYKCPDCDNGVIYNLDNEGFLLPIIKDICSAKAALRRNHASWKFESFVGNVTIDVLLNAYTQNIPAAPKYFLNNVKHSFEDTLACALIKIFELIGFFGIDMNSAKESTVINSEFDNEDYYFQIVKDVIKINVRSKECKTDLYGLFKKIYKLCKIELVPIDKYIELRLLYNNSLPHKL